MGAGAVRSSGVSQCQTTSGNTVADILMAGLNT